MQLGKGSQRITVYIQKYLYAGDPFRGSKSLRTPNGGCPKTAQKSHGSIIINYHNIQSFIVAINWGTRKKPHPTASSAPFPPLANWRMSWYTSAVSWPWKVNSPTIPTSWGLIPPVGIWVSENGGLGWLALKIWPASIAMGKMLVPPMFRQSHLKVSSNEPIPQNRWFSPLDRNPEEP